MKANEAALRHSQKDLQKLAGRLISAQEEELRRLSRELHDDLTQRLAVLAIEAGKLELDLIRMPEKCSETVHTLAQIKNQLIKVSEDVHTISRQLHPTILDDLGLVRAIESECSAVMRRHPVEIVFRRENVSGSIPDDIGLCLYRVVQEGLRNIAAHSGSKNCEIFLRCDDHSLCLTVSDDGIGFDPLEVRKMPGLGLSSMRERVQLIQGDFSITSRPGKGTVISVCVPLTGGEI
jgi:signal transduction histidine kinase